MSSIDLNCDLGESHRPDRLALDESLLAVVSSANIACGGHAGDEATMSRLVRAAAALGVAVGAHPGYPDRAGFGRVELDMTPGAIEASVAEQVRALGRFAEKAGTPITHVKPHGALYHAAMRRPEVARAVARAVRAVQPGAALVGLAGAAALDLWRSMGFRVLAEAFADRMYLPDGSLAPRSRPDALIPDADRGAEQAVAIAAEGRLRASDGTWIVMHAQTICIHSDTPGALMIARGVRAALEKAGFTVAVQVRPQSNR